MVFMGIIAAIFTVYIKRSGMTQVQIAQHIGVSKANITNWLNGTSMPDIDTISRICKAIQVKMSVMLGESTVSDNKKERLVKNYESLNDEARDELVGISDLMASKPRNRKKS